MTDEFRLSNLITSDLTVVSMAECGDTMLVTAKANPQGRQARTLTLWAR
jgi:hypothetical protein